MDENKPTHDAVAQPVAVQCSCSRCRHGGLMWPSILVTLGVLLLLNEWNILYFHRSWPILLIVIGAVRVLWHAADTSGHLEPQNPPGGPAPPPPADNSPKQVEHV